MGLSPFGRLDGVIWRPEGFPAVALVGAWLKFAIGFFCVLGCVRAIGADGDGADTECFGDVVDMVEEGIDVAIAAKESGHVGDAHCAAGVEYSADDVVGFAADVFIESAGDGVADDNGLVGCVGSVEAGLPAGVGEVDNDAEVVHFGNGGMAKVAQSCIFGFATAVAYGVAAVVGKMHHAHAKLGEDAQVTEFFLRIGLIADEGDAVAGEVGAVFAGFVSGDDVVGHGVGDVSVSGKAFHEA